jgi:hypothetical protein
MDDDLGRFIRPYAMTGGRTKATGDEIPLEAQISTSISVRSDANRYRWEGRKLLELCVEPMALVEVAARLEIPIGVARIVVSDLAAAGVVEVKQREYATSPGASASGYTDLLEKVLDGIRNL